LEALEGRWAPAVLVVTTAADSGPGSLRQALLDANDTATHPGLDTINFSIGSGAQTIALSSPLPAVTDPVILDGTTQPGWAGLPVLTLDGHGAGATDGLDLMANSSAVRGLTITGFAGSAVVVFSSFDAFQGNFLVGNGLDGATVVGSSDTFGGNLISGNGRAGVFVLGSCGLQSNRIGTNAAGTAALPNAADGITAVGNNGPGGGVGISGNLISGNGGSGVTLLSTGGAVLSGNDVGTNAAGTAAIPNGIDGVTLLGSSFDFIGDFGAEKLASNLISGNRGSGVFIGGGGNNSVANNKIGTNTDGTAALPNALDGITIDRSSDNEIAGSGNLISGNGRVGILVGGAGATGNFVRANEIGTDGAGAAALPNAMGGVVLYSGASGNSVGTSVTNVGGPPVTFRDANLVSGNGGFGVTLSGFGTTGNVVEAGRIGTNAAGTAALPNAAGGVALLDGAAGNVVGSTSAGAGNLVSGNGGPGVTLGLDTNGNVVLNNRIGTNAAGTAALPNAADGVALLDGATGNLVTANLVSGNGRFGVSLTGGGDLGNLIQSNQIGLAADNSPLGNRSHGVLVADGAHDNQIGDTGLTLGAAGGNVIAFNGGDGVRVEGGSDDSILGNSIHDNVGLGIDLVFGANRGQSAPVITAVAAGAGGGTDVTFTLDSTPSTAFRVEFFANAAADPSGFGEGQTFLGAATVSTDAKGHAAVTAHLPGAVGAGQKVTATATDPAGNTSEFSADFPAPG
jgi:parallel beta-helix repeat protein